MPPTYAMRPQNTTPNPPPDGLAIALRLLGMRGYSEARLRQKLADKGCDKSTVNAVVARLKEWRLLDDQSFGSATVRDWANIRHASNRRIELKLRDLGIDPKTITLGGEDIDPEIDRAIVLAERKLQHLTTLESWQQKQKLLAYLAGRGFDYSTSKAAIEQLLNNR